MARGCNLGCVMVVLFPKEPVIDDDKPCWCCCERADGRDEEPAVDTVSLVDETEAVIETGAAGPEGIAGATRDAFLVSWC
jgi:hypothetical protein